uniref:Uncharacterized protein n=1 Tax=Janibacter limosus TaxID=53458 RepID=A0AC61U522_9MICO|nr:hypothetical protein [Janibacter limosus]
MLMQCRGRLVDGGLRRPELMVEAGLEGVTGRAQISIGHRAEKHESLLGSTAKVHEEPSLRDDRSATNLATLMRQRCDSFEVDPAGGGTCGAPGLPLGSGHGDRAH